jgi:N-acyl-D-amino-acid deacylase
LPFGIRELTGRGLALALLGLIASSAASAAIFDVILRHGTVIDGSGEPRFQADVALSNGVIVRIGDLHRDHGRLDLDVTGLFITPGFISPHSHADADAVGAATNMLTQGVTTEFVNPDGQGPLDIRKQLSDYAASGLAINLGAYVGFNSAWESVMGATDHRATSNCVLID